MPTYEYECKICGHNFDVFQSILDEPLRICPECGKDLRRVINGGTGVIFKGSGFYITDKGGKSSQSSAAIGDKTSAGNKTSTGDKVSADSSAGTKTTETKTAGTESGVSSAKPEVSASKTPIS